MKKKNYLNKCSDIEDGIDKEVREGMKQRKLKEIWGSIGVALFTAICLCLVINIVPAHALDCQAVQDDGLDSDNDGYTDFMECNGLSSADPNVFLSADFPGRTNCQTTRAECFDPDSKDVFVIFTPGAASRLADLGFPSGGFDPFEYVSNEPDQGGLGITVHVISMTDLKPAVTDSADPENYRKIIERTVNAVTIWQKAITVTENTTSPLYDNNGNIQALGNSSWGTPNGQDNINIYMGRMWQHIDELCGADYGTVKCSDQTGAIGDDLFRNMAKNTMAHEFGHDVGARDESVDRYDGHHYSSKEASIMRQFNSVTTRKGAYWDLPQKFDPGDQANISLTWL